MSSLPSIEALEARHSFPCSYMFKVIGRSEQEFVARVISAFRDELQIPEDPPYRFRQTQGGNHVSVTVEPNLESAQQVLALYSRISQMSGLVMLL